MVKVVKGNGFKDDIDKSKGIVSRYDGLNRLVSAADPYGNTISYEYDVLDDKTKETDQRGNVTRYEYNPDRTVSKVMHPD